MANQQGPQPQPTDIELDEDTSAQQLAGETQAIADELGLDTDEAEMQVIEDEDGGAIINFEEKSPPRKEPEHYENLVDELDFDDLAALIDKQLRLIEMDMSSRQKRDERIERGLQKTGLGEPSPGGADFDGASKVDHPLMAEACVDFTAKVMKELFPPEGIVKSKITSDKNDGLKRAQRKSQFMNWQLLGPNPQIEEYLDENEALISQLGIGGTQYLKWFWEPDLKRPSCQWIPRENIYKPYSATNFYTAARITELEQITSDELQVRIDQELYVDAIELEGEPQLPEEASKTQEANDRLQGKEAPERNLDGLRTLYHQWVWLRLEGDKKSKGERAPYYLVIDKESKQCLALYRNWQAGDSRMKKMDWIVEFKFIPFGSDAIGFPELIGNLTTAATGALRALLDSAHFSNFPAFAKLTTPGTSGESISPTPGQVIEIEAAATATSIQSVFMPIQWQQPSPVLFQLLGFLEQAGKGVVTTAEEKIQDINAQTPATSTLALIEQGSKVMSSIMRRLHNAQAKSLQILSRLNYWYLDEQDNQSGTAISVKDFNENTDIAPVSDPNIISETHRAARLQMLIQLAATAPQLYNMRELHKTYLETMKFSDIDKFMPNPAGINESNPILENVQMTMGQPAAAYPDQDHLAHLFIHMEYYKDPNLGGSAIIAPTFAPKLVEHAKQHLSMYYLQTVRKEVINVAGEDIFKLNEEKPLTALEQKALAATIVNITDDLQAGLSPFAQDFQALLQKVQEAAKAAKENAAMADPNAAVILKTETARLQQEGQMAQLQLQQKAKEAENKYQEAIAKLQTQVTDMEAKYRQQADLMANDAAAKVAITAMQNESKERIEEMKLGMQADQAQQQLHAQQTQVAMEAAAKAHEAIATAGLALEKGFHPPPMAPELESTLPGAVPPEEGQPLPEQPLSAAAQHFMNNQGAQNG